MQAVIENKAKTGKEQMTQREWREKDAKTKVMKIVND